MGSHKVPVKSPQLIGHCPVVKVQMGGGNCLLLVGHWVNGHYHNPALL